MPVIPSGDSVTNNTTNVTNPVLRTLVRDSKTSGTNGGSGTGATWNIRTLTEKVYDDLGVTLASNVITLPSAGTYEFDVFAIANGTGVSIIRLFDATNTTVIATGLVVTALAGNCLAQINKARYTILGSTNIRLEHYIGAANIVAAQTFGAPASIGGQVELYASVGILKVA